jgi:quinol monooxygenase YgiN
MALPMTVITIIETTDAVRANANVFSPTFDHLISMGVKGWVTPVDGIVQGRSGTMTVFNRPIYYGLEAENPKIGVTFVNWDSYEQHQAIVHTPAFAKLVASAAPALAAPYKLYHVRFSAPTIALNYPVTEVAILTLKAPENRAGVVAILSGIAKATNNLYAFGLTRGDDNKYVAICGWESVEAHRKAVSNPESQERLKKLYALADQDRMYNVKLKKFGGA